MKPLRNRLLEARKRLGIPWEILERDYALSWLLAGISQVEPLRDTLVFKGGTALKKCFFGDYRFSDFSSFLRAKCTIRNVSFDGPDDFFEKTMLNYVEKTWEQWLGPLVPDLPDFNTVIGELRPKITFLVSKTD